MMSPSCKSTRAKSVVNYSHGPLSCQMWGAGSVELDIYFINTGNQQQCKEPSQKPIVCLSVFQWHARKISSQPEKDTTEEQYIMSGVASVADTDGRRLTRSSGFCLVNKACSVVPVFYLFGLAKSTPLLSCNAETPLFSLVQYFFPHYKVVSKVC
uniref:Uncharacterized protein n=1 Tax=Mesocestoides corti TaxID=53468 RepID=A0A5K3G6L2_MESCO